MNKNPHKDKLYPGFFNFLIDLFITKTPGPQERVKGKKGIEYYEELRKEWLRLLTMKLRSRRYFFLWFLLSIIGAGILLFLYILNIEIGIINHEAILIFFIWCLVYACAFLIMYLSSSVKSYKEEIARIDYEIDFIEAQDSPEETKAQRIFKYHQSELKRYYDQALTASKSIFRVGIICIFLGFIIIAITFSLLYLFSSKNFPTVKLLQYLTAITGSISTIVTNYIGTIYLKMYSTTLSSFSTFQYRLVTTHHIHLANCLIPKITDQQIKNDTLSKLALNISNITKLDSIDNYSENPEEKKPNG